MTDLAPLTISSSTYAVTTVCHGSRIKTGCKVLDVDLNPPSDVHVVKFRNYYTHTVSVLFRSVGCSTWSLAMRECVYMSGGCHCDQGGQSWVVLDDKHFLTELENVVQIRLLLKQPSPNWREFSVEQLTLYHRGNYQAATSTNDCPQSEFISRKLTEMAALAGPPSRELAPMFSDLTFLAAD